MDALSIAAASGMRSRMESLDLLANNLANAGTAGFKADREFYSLYVAPEALDPNGAGDPATLPVIERSWTDYSQGTLTQTGNPADLAIAGKGFFVADTPGGPVYTRNGSFRVSVEDTGTKSRLLTKEGYVVRSRKDKPIQLDPLQPFTIDREGTVHQQGQAVGQLDIVDFDKLDGLHKQGATYFRLADSSISPKSTGAEIHQGQLEGANVGPVEAAVRLVTVTRGFEMMQRALTLANEINRKAVEEVGRVGS